MDEGTIKALLVAWVLFECVVRVLFTGKSKTIKFTPAGTLVSLGINAAVIWGVVSL